MNSKLLALFFLVGYTVCITDCLSSEDEDANDEKRLIKTSADKKAELMTEPEIWELIGSRKHFVDITDLELDENLLLNQKIDKGPSRIPTTLRYQAKVKEIIGTLNVTRVTEFFHAFTASHDRYYKSRTGVSSTKWLFSQIQESISKSQSKYAGSGVMPSVQEFNHSSWPQKSIIAKMPGVDPTLRNEVVIIGSHLDSINMIGRFLGAPGADDNGSGSAVVLETLRVLLESGLVSKRTLEFHWYSAEEGGLKGSGDVAKNYKKAGVDVVGMLNFDVVGHQEKGKQEVGIYTDNSDEDLLKLMRLLSETYLEYKWVDRTCGYGCSDHASWTLAGYPAAMAAEVKMNPKMHTSIDSVKSVSFPQVMEFAKMSVGYMVETAEPLHVE